MRLACRTTRRNMHYILSGLATIKLHSQDNHGTSRAVTREILCRRTSNTIKVNSRTDNTNANYIYDISRSHIQLNVNIERTPLKGTWPRGAVQGWQECYCRGLAHIMQLSAGAANVKLGNIVCPVQCLFAPIKFSCRCLQRKNQQMHTYVPTPQKPIKLKTVLCICWHALRVYTYMYIFCIYTHLRYIYNLMSCATDP
jgi:hypothetical protein